MDPRSANDSALIYTPCPHESRLVTSRHRAVHEKSLFLGWQYARRQIDGLKQPRPELGTHWFYKLVRLLNDDILHEFPSFALSNIPFMTVARRGRKGLPRTTLPHQRSTDSMTEDCSINRSPLLILLGAIQPARESRHGWTQKN